MPRLLFLTFALVAVMLTSGACNVQRTFLVGQSYPRNPDPGSIRLFIGELETPHAEIAYVHSQVAPDKRVATRREMIADLRKRAAKVGADAIMDVQLLAEDHRGITLNRATPIRTPMQGEYKRYFMRGTAIRLLDDVDSLEPALQPAPPEDGTLEDGTLGEATLGDDFLEAIPEVEPVSAPSTAPSPRAAY